MTEEREDAVLFVSRNIPFPGHSENDIILQLATKLQQTGLSVSLAFPAEWLPIPEGFLTGIRRAIAALPERFSVQGHSVQVLKYLRLPGLQFSYLLADRFRHPELSSKPRWVHAHYVLPDGIMARAISKRQDCPYVVSVRQGDMRKWQQMPQGSALASSFRDVLDGAAVVFTPSPSLLKALSDIGVNATLLPHGMTLPNQPPLQKSKVDVGISIFVAATLLPLKHIDWLIDALATLPDDTRLVIAGDGPEREALVSQTDRLGVSSRVQFLGAVSRQDVQKWMRESDIYALPSVSETFGLSYLEAAANGCAVLACRHTGVHGCFVEDQEMVFCEPDREDAIKVLGRLCRDASLRRRVASGGLARVKEDYQWSRVVENYLGRVRDAVQC